MKKIMDRRDFLRFRHIDPVQSAWKTFLYELKKRGIESCGQTYSLGEGAYLISMPVSDISRVPSIVILARQYGVGVRVLSYQQSVEQMLESMISQGSPQSVVCLDFYTLSSMELLAHEVQSIGSDHYLSAVTVPIAFFKQQGFEQFSGLPDDLLLLDWLANPIYHDQRPLGLSSSGISKLQCVLSDGSSTVVGGFGVDVSQSVPLAQLHEIVPALFTYLHDEDIRVLMLSPQWPQGLYRLDALQGDISLAQFFLGSQNTLVLPIRCAITKGKVPDSGYLSKCTPNDSNSITHYAFHQMQVKGLFDEYNVFADCVLNG